MACVVVSAAAAIITGGAKYIVRHHENKTIKSNDYTKIESNTTKFGSHLKLSKKLGILELALFVGSFILAIEHIIHGEIVPYFPFLTALGDTGSALTMLKEMATVGVSMTLAIVFAWMFGVFFFDLYHYHKDKKNIISETK